MGFTSLSRKYPRLRRAARSAVEGSALSAAAAAAMGLLLERALMGPALAGLGAAWAASVASVGVLVWARGRGFRPFMRAFGWSVALRAAVLAGLMAAAWDEPWEVQGALLGTYALGCPFLLMLEFRHVGRSE